MAVALAIGALLLCWRATGRTDIPSRLYVAFYGRDRIARGYMFNIGVAKGWRIRIKRWSRCSPRRESGNGVVVMDDLPVEWLSGVSAVGRVFYGMARTQLRPLLRRARTCRAAGGLVPRVRRQMVYSTLIVTVGFIVSAK